ncbi:Mitochondrial carrier domain,Mitochondrial substrate/solute carrier [Cinara cedri]|uniref:Mitochondrial carrier domain,Mitochondrial substrate/solute carrier n=1 Tax=Cinara cedri TaxID=506608 RepID=A0A5E4M624_9HEMI|nr:Mitochondrial carrier domain,Mitochondrial substrate/solute carrier [Cinara cedri]
MDIYFLLCDYFYCALKKSWEHNEIKNEPMLKYIKIIAGSLVGITSWILVLLIDVIKTKIIVDSFAKEPLYKGTWDCVKKTYAQGGATIIFRGLVLLCIRTFPVNSIAFLVYGVLKNIYSDDSSGENDKGTSEPTKDEKIIKISVKL